MAGGWTLSTFQVYQAGFPLAFGLARSTAGANSGRPNADGDPAQGVAAPSSTGSLTISIPQPSPSLPIYLWQPGPYIGTVRSPGMNNVGLDFAKDFRFAESKKLQFRFSVFNLLNHPVFSGPNTTLGNAVFGVVSSQANYSRQLEVAAKILF